MDLHQRHFEFHFHGLHVFCCASLYSDGSLHHIDVEYILSGLVDWLAITSGPQPALIRFLRMQWLKKIRTAAAQHAQSALLFAHDTYEFEF